MSNIVLGFILILTLALGALVSWTLTFYVMNKKLVETKRTHRVSLRTHGQDEYDRGRMEGVTTVERNNSEQLEHVYKLGYEDGVANERDIAEDEKTGKHRWNGADATTKLSLVPTIEDGQTQVVERITPGDDPTRVMIASSYTETDKTEVISSCTVLYDAA